MRRDREEVAPFSPPRRGRRRIGVKTPPDALFLVAGVAGLLLVGCGGEAGVSGPEDDDDGDDLRPGLEVTVEPGPEAADLVAALGWAGGVPDAEVRIHELGTDFEWKTKRTDASGRVHFPEELSGRYRVAALRLLSADEASELGTRIRAFADGTRGGVSEQSPPVELDLRPDEAGSLVFSEIYAPAPFVEEASYDFHMYFEVYNNADTTAYLDGVLFGSMLGLPTVDEALGAPCTVSAEWNDDPDGIWAHWAHQFPGSGRDHPLAPGEAALVAMDAVDHSEVDPRFPDLRGADFELLGSGDVDNPDVPNVPEAGLRSFFLGHGLRIFIGHRLFLTSRLDVGTLERRLFAEIGEDFLLFPREKVLDVVWTDDDDALAEQRFTRCHPLVNEAFDRLGGGFLEHGTQLRTSVYRRELMTVGGRKILQDTNVSAVDLVLGPYTPGSPP